MRVRYKTQTISNAELFVTIIKLWKPLAVVTKSSISDLSGLLVLIWVVWQSTEQFIKNVLNLHIIGGFFFFIEEKPSSFTKCLSLVSSLIFLMFFSLVNCRCFYLSILMIRNVMLLSAECAKFSGSHAIVSHRESRDFSWVLRGSQIFSRGFFAGPRFLLVGISWVQNFSGPVFREPKNFLVGISWVQSFFLCVFCRSTIYSHWVFCESDFFILVANFVI